MTDQTDYNDASSNKWLMVLPFDLNLVARKVTDFEIPGVSADGTIGPRVSSSTMMIIPADTIFFDPVVYTFIVDESYENYITLMSKLLNTPKSQADQIFFDFTVMPLSNTGRPTGVEFVYMNAMLSNMSTISLENNASVKTLTCTVTLKFENMKILRNGVVVADTSSSKI